MLPGLILWMCFKGFVRWCRYRRWGRGLRLNGMSNYPIHTIETAPELSKPALRELQQSFGMIPNIAGVMAESPTLLGAFVPVFRQVHSGTFTEAEIQVILLTNARTNRSAWPIAFHTALALQAGVSAAAVQAIREQQRPEEPKLAALSALARSLIEQRGHLGGSELRAFTEAGYTRAQVLEVVTVVAASTMTNYTASVAQPELETAFRAFAFESTAQEAAAVLSGSEPGPGT